MCVDANVTKTLGAPVRITDLPRQRYIVRYHKVKEKLQEIEYDKGSLSNDEEKCGEATTYQHRHRIDYFLLL